MRNERIEELDVETETITDVAPTAAETAVPETADISQANDLSAAPAKVELNPLGEQAAPKNDLLATVSHELKTPLASMRVLVDTLVDADEHDEQRVREYLGLIAKENARLSRLIENFLTFSRMERNKVKFDREEMSAAAIVAATRESVGERFHGPDCRFEVEVPTQLPSVVADRDALVTVLLNLLDNAYKYSKGEKEIHLRAFAENGDVCFAVEDRGIGLSRQSAKRVFERFFQVDQSLARSGSGVGLGLSIVHFIVDAHGGTIDVESEPGAGSTFTVRLPAASGNGTGGQS